MKLSFVIPAYNEEKNIAACLTSIQREIARNAYDVEVIVVNNASSDHTHEIAASFAGVVVVDEMRKGIVYARKAGYLVSVGDIIANVDADTILPEGWLATVMNEFIREPELAALSGPFIFHDVPPYMRVLMKIFYVLAYCGYLINRFVLRVGSMLQGGNFVVRRTSFEKIGGFDTNIEFYGEDADVARRLHAVGPVRFTFRLPMYSSGRRILHEGLLTMGAKYAINYASTIFLKKPFTKNYIDVRPSGESRISSLSRTWMVVIPCVVVLVIAMFSLELTERPAHNHVSKKQNHHSVEHPSWILDIL